MHKPEAMRATALLPSKIPKVASGLPSIITSIAGSVDLVRDGEEAIAVPGWLPSVTSALAQYVGSPRLQAEHGAAARARVLSHFSARSILDRHIRLYQRVMTGGDAAKI